MRNHGEGVSSSNLGQTQTHPLTESGCFLSNRSQYRLDIARTLNEDQKKTRSGLICQSQLLVHLFRRNLNTFHINIISEKYLYMLRLQENNNNSLSVLYKTNTKLSFNMKAEVVLLSNELADLGCAGKAKAEPRKKIFAQCMLCLLYTSPSPRDLSTSRMPSSA